MNYDDFIGAVQNRAKLGDRERAVRAIRATLETYAERLLDEQANHLAAQLPQELGEYLRHVHGTQRFDSNEFLKRVSDKEKVGIQDATYHARVVTEVLQEAVSQGRDRQDPALAAGRLPADLRGR